MFLGVRAADRLGAAAYRVVATVCEGFYDENARGAHDECRLDGRLPHRPQTDHGDGVAGFDPRAARAVPAGRRVVGEHNRSANACSIFQVSDHTPARCQRRNSPYIVCHSLRLECLLLRRRAFSHVGIA